MSLFKKQKKDQQNFNTSINKTNEAYEEISEKKTSKLGYILLIIMSLFIISVTQTIFSDLKKIPTKPTLPSRCVATIINSNSLQNITYKGKCYFHDIDKKFNLDKKYNELLPQLEQIISLNKTITKNESTLRSFNRNIEKLNNDYDLSLQEKIAAEPAIMDKTTIKLSITQQKEKINNLEHQNLNFIKQRQKIINSIKPQIDILSTSYNQAKEYYKNKSAYYNFKVFLLMLLFVLPFFAFSIYYYLKLKKKNSPYTIIYTAIASSSAILFIQVVLNFLYKILPKEWLIYIFDFFMAIPFFSYIIYYSSVILIILLFGGLVYFIQKKVFHPSKVAIRRLKENKCPGCSFTLKSSFIFCPKCGQQIKEECPHCHQLKFRYLSHCPYCGKEHNSIN